jgi:uncharacterized protein YkwD
VPTPPLRGVLAAVLLVFAVPSAATAACPGADVVPEQPEQLADAERALVCLVNEARTSRDRPSLDRDGRLADAAGGHAADMVRRRYFSHTSPGGSDVRDRVRRAGYLPRGRGWAFGEILAWSNSRRARPSTVLDAWLRSPGHRALLLHPRFRDVGAGLALGTPRGRRGVTAAVTFGRH